MKVLHFITSLKVGGAESALVNFLTYTQRSFPHVLHEVLYLYDGPCVAKIKSLGIPTQQLKGLAHHYDPVAFMRLLKIIKKTKPDVLHTALWSANVMGRLAAHLCAIPVVSDLHGNSFDEGSFRNRCDAFTAPFTDKIIAVSPSVKASYEGAVISRFFSVKNQKCLEKKLSVINNGIDVEFVRERAFANSLSRSNFALGIDDFVIGAVGRLEKIKSYDLLIRAFARLCGEQGLSKKPKLCIVGDGGERGKLEMLAQDLRIAESVIFLGSRNDAVRFYPLFDCFALSSRSEGLSIALLEALCFGLPIVSTHCGMQHDVITHNENGYLVPVGDEYALANALKLLLQDDQNRMRMKTANLDLISNFDLAHTANAYVRVYKELIGSRDYPAQTQ